LAQRMLGIVDTALYSPDDVAAIRNRMHEIRQRIQARAEQIKQVVAAESEATQLTEKGEQQ
ncbi:MAG: SPFH domain-containing protein, partial [Chloroflexus sp.]|nr:SPFH domain-containing protein [Chloroflexus sp.]